MFVATTNVANKQIYPFAFGYGDGENDQSWTYFSTKSLNFIKSP